MITERKIMKNHTFWINMFFLFGDYEKLINIALLINV